MPVLAAQVHRCDADNVDLLGGQAFGMLDLVRLAGGERLADDVQHRGGTQTRGNMRPDRQGTQQPFARRVLE